jgi:hypothetical protein
VTANPPAGNPQTSLLFTQDGVTTAPRHLIDGPSGPEGTSNTSTASREAGDVS